MGAVLARSRTVLGAILLIVAVTAAVAPSAPPAAADDSGWADAKRSLEQAVQAKDAGALKAAIAKVAKDDSERAVKALLVAAFSAQELDVYKELLAAFASMKSKEAVATTIELAREHRDWQVRYLLVEALGGMPAPEAEKALQAAFHDKHESVAGAALRAARAKPSAATVSALIEVLEKLEKKERDGRVYGEAQRSLEAITGEKISSSFEWRSWWKVHEDGFDPKKAAEQAGKSGGDDMHTVLRRIDERGEKQFVDELKKGDIICVSGQFDHVDAVLDHLKLPYEKVDRKDFAQKAAKLDPHSILVFNCHNHDSERFTEAEIKRLAAFVEAGGYVFTSDWELRNVIEKAFTGYIGVGRETGEHEFPILPAKAAEKHPYLRDVFPENPFARARFKWKIDNVSYTVKIGKAQAVISLVESAQLGQMYGSPIVACTFRHGKGAVLHVLSHFERQQDESGDGFALQQLFVNFVIEKQKWRRAEMEKRKKSGGK